jgi:cytoskeletal protein CcmA (bactofilin family)
MTKLLLCALLLSYAPATSPFSLSARCRTRTVVAQQAYPQHNNDDAQFNDGRTQATHIARGTTIKADTFASSNPLVIDGELCVAQLDCREEIQISGKVVGNVQGGALVIVDGELEGSVDCEELVVGPAGMVTGAVCCRDL